MPALAARYVHTNLTARDWRALARFYVDVFGCAPVPPERDFRGPALDALTSLADAHLTGAHLRLPGWGADGPTLEIFQYSPALEPSAPAANRPGYGHIAFAVEDVPAALAAVRAAGGGALGQVVTLTIAGGARVTACYASDPEGNLIELQSWAPPA